MKRVGSFKRNDFFVRKFNDFYTEWRMNQKKNGHRGSQSEFARLVVEAEKELHPNNPLTKCDYRYVSKWLNGVMRPEGYLEAIAQVLGVSVDEFTPKTHDDQYKHSEEYMNGIQKDEIEPFCDMIGLDVEFLKILESMIDFDEKFPLWRPMERTKNILADYVYYLLPESSLCESAPMKDGVFQVERIVNENGKEEKRLITLSKPDLLFLRDIQRSIKKYLEFRFAERADEMEKEVEEANRLSMIPLEGGGTAIRLLKRDEIINIAPYYRAFDYNVNTDRTSEIAKATVIRMTSDLNNNEK